METNLLDRMLSTYLDEKIVVTMTLQNKIRVSGRIKAFDSYVIVMDDQKREIVYRHAVSCIAPSAPVEQKRQAVQPQRQPVQPRPAQAKAPSRPSRPHAQHPVHPRPQALSASANDQQINSSMKEGLLKWMQDQKAAK